MMLDRCAPEIYLLRSSLAADDSLCYFGVGALLDACYPQLVLATGRRPDFLCDNAPEKWSRTYHGVPCVSPNHLPRNRERTTIVICIRNHEAVEKQLRALGYTRIWLANFSRGYHCVSGLRELGLADSTPASRPPLDLKGQWALITGATRGIGRMIAEALAGRGLNIVCHGKTIDSAQRASQALADSGVDTLAVAADLTRTEDIDHLCNWLATWAPSLCVVYNNAGISPFSPSGFWKMGHRDFIDCFTVNALAPIRICQTVIPTMRTRGFGRIVNVSSSIQKRPGEMAYACSKAALDKFVHDLVPSLDGSGVMLSLLDPGWLSTDMGGRWRQTMLQQSCLEHCSVRSSTATSTVAGSRRRITEG